MTTRPVLARLDQYSSEFNKASIIQKKLFGEYGHIANIMTIQKVIETKGIL